MILVLEDHDKNSPGPFLMSERLGSFSMGAQKMGQQADGTANREFRKSSANGEAYVQESDT
jgi:hypothetical protein